VRISAHEFISARGVTTQESHERPAPLHRFAAPASHHALRIDPSIPLPIQLQAVSTATCACTSHSTFATKRKFIVINEDGATRRESSSTSTLLSQSSTTFSILRSNRRCAPGVRQTLVPFTDQPCFVSLRWSKLHRALDVTTGRAAFSVPEYCGRRLKIFLQ